MEVKIYDLFGEISHAYISKKYGPYSIKLACDKNWYHVFNKGKYTGRYFNFDDVRQWSIGAGYNATCPYCLIEYGKITSLKLNKTFSKLKREI